MVGYVYPTPTASIYEDIPQYVGLLLGAVDNGLDRLSNWDEADYESSVRGYLEDVRSFIAELPDMLNGLTPIGGCIPYAGANPPVNWLVCNGSEVSTIDYPELGVAIGSSGGIITLPDLRGRVAVGVGQGANLTNRTLLAAFGAENHQLTTNEIPSHSHNTSIRRNTTSAGSGGFKPIAWNGINTEGTDSSPATTSTGGGLAHNNMQPSLGLNYIIRAK